MARWQTADYLRERGYNIIEATGVFDALSLLGSGMHVDIVFSNVPSADESDRQVLAEWLEEHRPSLPLLMTANVPVETMKLPSILTTRVIAPPYELAQLAAYIDSILKGS